jgi:haloalkane dehalogenase
VVDRLGGPFQQTFATGDALQRAVIDAVFRLWPLPGSIDVLRTSAAPSTTTRTMISYTHGHGRFSADRKFITLDNTIYRFGGGEDGYHQGVWERHFVDSKELLATPPNPERPLDQPVGPVPATPVAASTKAIWSFRDGAIYSVGPAASHLIPLPDGSFLFLVSTAQVITGGTGVYQGAYGMTQSLGATHVPVGVNLFEGEPKPFPAATIDTFTYTIAGARPVTTERSASRETPRPESRVDFEWPRGVESQHVDVCGSRIHVLTAGRGEPVVFVHGNPVWSYVWRNVLPYVIGTGGCVAPDLIGMGLSDHPDIPYGFFTAAKYFEAFVERLKLRRITLVLHDWGTAVGFFYAMRNSANVRRLVMMEALFKPYASWSDFPAPLRRTFQAFRTPRVGVQKIVVENAFIEELLPMSVVRTLEPAEMDAYRFPFRAPSSRKLIWEMANDLPIGGVPRPVHDAVAAYSKWLRNSAIPKLLIHGDPGAITSRADVAWARQNLRNLTVVSVGRGLHFLQEDHPEGVGRAIAEWCSGTR